MSARLEKYIDHLKLLHTNKKLRSAIVENSNQGLILCLCECVENILNGNVSLTTKQRAQLKSYAKVLRQIRDKGVKVETKRRLLVQKGGFLTALLAPIIAGLAGIFLK